MAHHGVAHQGTQSEADLGISVRVLHLPSPTPCESTFVTALQENILDMVIRLTNEPQKQWQLETVIANCPFRAIGSGTEKTDAQHLFFKYKCHEPGARSLSEGGEVVSVVKEILNDWCSMCMLYGRVLELQEYLKGGID